MKNTQKSVPLTEQEILDLVKSRLETIENIRKTIKDTNTSSDVLETLLDVVNTVSTGRRQGYLYAQIANHSNASNALIKKLLRSRHRNAVENALMRNPNSPFDVFVELLSEWIFLKTRSPIPVVEAIRSREMTAAELNRVYNLITGEAETLPNTSITVLKQLVLLSLPTNREQTEWLQYNLTLQ